MTIEDYLAMPGDTIQLRAGPYAGETATVLSVHPDKNHAAENSLVMVKLRNGRINACYMSNLDLVKKSSDSDSLETDVKGAKE